MTCPKVALMIHGRRFKGQTRAGRSVYIYQVIPEEHGDPEQGQSKRKGEPCRLAPAQSPPQQDTQTKTSPGSRQPFPHLAGIALVPTAGWWHLDLHLGAD